MVIMHNTMMTAKRSNQENQKVTMESPVEKMSEISKSYGVMMQT